MTQPGRTTTGEMCACGEGTVGLVQREGDTIAHHRADVCGWGEAALPGRTPSPCWGAFDGVALHEAHAYDGKWCPGLSGRTTSCKDAVVTVLPPSRDWPRAFSWHCRDCDKWGERHYDREQDAKAAVTRHLTTPASSLSQ